MAAGNETTLTERRKQATMLHLQADGLLRRGRPEEAITPAREAVSIMPGEPRFLITLGETLNFTGNHEEAMQQYQQAVENADRDRDREQWADAMKARAWGHDVSGNHEAAVADLSTIINAKDEWPARSRRALALGRLSRFPEGIDDLQRAIALRGENDANLEALLGNAHRSEAFRQLKETDTREAQFHAQRAIHHLERAMDMSPGHMMATAGLMTLMTRLALFDLDDP